MAEKNKGGRPAGPVCVYNLRFRMSQEDKDLFDQKFKKSNCKNQKDFFIQLVRKSDDLGLFNEANKESRQVIRQLESDIYHTTNNINQIAHFLNAAGYTTTDEDVKRKLDLVLEYLPELQSKLRRVDSIIDNFKL